MTRGFSLLRLRFSDDASKALSLKRILWVSDRNAEQLQELGLALSLAAKDNGSIIDSQLLDETITCWINSQDAAACSAIEAKMSPADTMFGRRNQLLYCIGNLEADEFGIVDVKREVRRVFPNHCDWIDEDFDPIFLEFLEGFTPIPKADTQQGSYRVKKAVYRMAMRALLHIDDDGGVYKVSRVG